MTRILGLDVSLSATGVALPDGTFATIRHGKPKTIGYLRHAQLLERVYVELARARPDVVVVEDYAPRALGINSLIVAGELQGPIRTRLELLGIPWVGVRPNTLKLYATGKGNARKEAMADAAEADLPRGAPRPGNFDEADAYWLRAMGADHYDDGLGNGLEHRVKALESVAWPDLEEDTDGTP